MNLKKKKRDSLSERIKSYVNYVVTRVDGEDFTKPEVHENYCGMKHCDGEKES